MILLNGSNKGDALFVSRILKEMGSRHQPFTAQPKPQYPVESRSHLDGRAETTQDPCQRHQSWSDRHTDLGRGTD